MLASARFWDERDLGRAKTAIEKCVVALAPEVCRLDFMLSRLVIATRVWSRTHVFCQFNRGPYCS